MTMDDVNVLESTAKPPSSKKPGQGVVNCATETDERVNFYTGLHSKSILQGVYDSISGGVDQLKYWIGAESTFDHHNSGRQRPERQHQLPHYYQLLMCLIRLRLNLPLLLLADLFDVSCSTVTRITITWISYMYQTLVAALLVWPSQANIQEGCHWILKSRSPIPVL
ncbi:uncharacterized protein LOC102801621 [Saccoglossus kowalevskii]|nr:PREDICTED: uncharacterized protein LOC102801731 [Saccoglossus kowalevskii]